MWLPLHERIIRPRSRERRAGPFIDSRPKQLWPAGCLLHKLSLSMKSAVDYRCRRQSGYAWTTDIALHSMRDGKADLNSNLNQTALKRIEMPGGSIPMHELKWSHAEKTVARRAFDKALGKSWKPSSGKHYEGYDKGDANSRLIVSNVALKEFMNGTPPCHAQFQDLCQIGFKNAGAIPNRRRAGCNGEIFREGILEAIIELGRNQLVAENGCVQLETASSSTVIPKVETGPRLVHFCLSGCFSRPLPVVVEF